MSKTLRILCLLIPLSIVACGEQSEVTESKVVETSTTTTVVEFIPPPSITTTTMAPTTTVAPTTTTTKPQVSAASAGPAVQAEPVSSDSIWDKIAQCESHGNWSLNAHYDGGLQFAESTWTSYVAAGKPYAMQGYPPYAYQATREMQIAVAIRVRDGVKGSSAPYLNPQGYGAWPRCRRAAGV